MKASPNCRECVDCGKKFNSSSALSHHRSRARTQKPGARGGCKKKTIGSSSNLAPDVISTIRDEIKAAVDVIKQNTSDNASELLHKLELMRKESNRLAYVLLDPLMAQAVRALKPLSHMRTVISSKEAIMNLPTRDQIASAERPTFRNVFKPAHMDFSKKLLTLAQAAVSVRDPHTRERFVITRISERGEAGTMQQVLCIDDGSAACLAVFQLLAEIFDSKTAQNLCALTEPPSKNSMVAWCDVGCPRAHDIAPFAMEPAQFESVDSDVNQAFTVCQFVPREKLMQVA